MQKKHHVQMTEGHRNELKSLTSAGTGPVRRAARTRIRLKAAEMAEGPAGMMR